MTLFFLIYLLVLVLPDFYIWLSFVRGNVSWIWSAAYWLPSVISILLLSFGFGWHGTLSVRVLFFLVLCVALPKLLFAIVSVAGRCAGLLLPHASTWGNIAGLGIALVACGAFFYGCVWGWHRLEVKEQLVESKEVPKAFDGYRIVQLSDLHVGTNGSDVAYIEKLVAKVNALQPDLIVFTGDLVNASPSELDSCAGILSLLYAPDGVFSVLGNHDYCLYNRGNTPEGMARDLEVLKSREKAMGWDLLLNEHRVIRRGNDSLYLAGVENVGKPPFPSKGDLGKALKGIPDDAFAILLSHDPSHWRREVLPSSSVQLMLAGHTHAMQFKVGGFSPSSWVYHEWAGLYEEGGRLLHVSVGQGGTAPFRLGAWPEITVLTLHRK